MAMKNPAEIEQIQLSSNYLSTLIRRRPDSVDWLWRNKQLYRRYPLTELYQDLHELAGQADSLPALMRVFREFKQRHFLRIGGRDLLGLADLEETTSQLSDLAVVSIQAGLNILRQRPHWWLGEDQGRLWQEGISERRLVVMGLGKLGGDELNYVSDVDISIFRESGARSPGSESLVSVLSRLVQNLGRLLAEPVDGDRVFQVDFRLRPGGKEGALVPSAEAAAEHYLNHGSSWERQMLLKARPVAGDRSLGAAFLQELRPFIYRRFLDFQALDELRDMRDRILFESARPGRQQAFDVKLGVGGIREVEFMVQSFQLVYGGRHPQLEEPNTLRCLDQLQQLQLLPAEVVAELRDAYRFLRQIEHWIQLDQNRQTQKLPQSPESRRRLAQALGFDGDYSALEKVLNAFCASVHEHFTALFQTRGRREDGEPEDAGEVGADSDPADFAVVWRDPAFSGLGEVLATFSRPARNGVAQVLCDLRKNHRRLPEDLVGNRLEGYFTRVKRRPGLVRMLDAPGPWLDRLCRGIAQSGLLATLLSHQPNLVEGLLSLSEPFLDAAAWEQFGNHLLARHQDYEEAIEWIRRLKNERLLMVALADLAGDVTQAAVEENLTRLALYVMRHTYRRVAEQLSIPADLPLSVLGLGKLGSGEFNYLSDLDLVYVYDPGPEQRPDQIPGQVVCLIQRFNRMLSVPLQEGPGYLVDTRLRPSGNYGPLVVTRSAWEHYYAEQADLWEIQALLRMRPVVGSERLAARLAEKARGICHQPRKPAEVWPRLCHLRRRMEAERSGDGDGWIDLKLGFGGLADMEFLVQGLQLLSAGRRPVAALPSVRDALLPALESLGVSPGERSETIGLCHSLRALEHRLHLHLNLSTAKIKQEQFETLLDLGLWPLAQDRTAIASWSELQAARRRIRATWQKITDCWEKA